MTRGVSPEAGFDALVARLTAAARRIGAARAAQLAAVDSPRRWRSAGLLWPLFAKD